MLFRYPGSKNKIQDVIITDLKNQWDDEIEEYREPFFGAGAICFNLLKEKQINNIWINDFDNNIACLWNAVLKNPVELRDLISSFVPSPDAFYQIKDELLNNKLRKEIEIGFKKIVIHQISYSGLGTKSGSPLGGNEQKSAYKIDCRWSEKTLHKNINNLHKLLLSTNLKENKCTNYDFETLLQEDNKKSIIYLDPPYFVKGNELYQYGFNLDDHKRLANCLLKTKHKWLLSYDDCDEIKKLYSWANIKKIPINYTIGSVRGKNELLISSI